MNIKEIERLAGTLTPQYVAGIIDGEGCIAIAKMKSSGRGCSPRHELRLSVANTNRLILDVLQKKYGGCVRNNPNHHDKWKQSYQWRTQGENAGKIIMEIQPYLIIKQEQAKNAINLRETVYKSFGRGYRISEEILEKRESYYLIMHSLNTRGVL